MKTQSFKARFRRWVRRNYGRRCPDYAKGCAVCTAWKYYDWLTEF